MRVDNFPLKLTGRTSSPQRTVAISNGSFQTTTTRRIETGTSGTAMAESEPVAFLYGCYGYTGKLICEEAKRRGLKLILGGRNADECFAVARAVEIDPDSPDNPNADKYIRVFDLDDENEISEKLASLPDECKVVMNAAGPFLNTFEPLVKGCLANNLSYLDVTGEVDIFERAHTEFKQQAKDKGVIVMPGCGMDIVPTDCLAAYLHEQLPSADHLELVFGAIPADESEGRAGFRRSSFSRGTTATAIDTLGGKRTLARINGKIKETDYSWVKVPLHEKFPQTTASLVSWGDISTAYHSTGIPNIRVYVMSEGAMKQALRAATWWPVRMLVKLTPRRVKQWFVPSSGPSQSDRDSVRSVFWGRAFNFKSGDEVTARMKSFSGYVITYLASVEAMIRVANMTSEELAQKCGSHTPSSLFGCNFLADLDSNAVFHNLSGEKSKLPFRNEVPKEKSVSRPSMRRKIPKERYISVSGSENP